MNESSRSTRPPGSGHGRGDRALASRRLGMLVPSSNTVLEPTTQAQLAAFAGDVSLHVARFRVTAIDLSDESRSQFDIEPMLEAARQLADARVDVIVWNGTSAAWLGVERDRALCEAITTETGIPSTTTVLATLDALKRLAARRVAIVTPYLDAVQRRIVDQWQALDFEVVAERHLADRGNFSFAVFDEARIAAEVRACSESMPDAILILCTNFRGAAVAVPIEVRCDAVVLDSVSVTTWQALAMAGADPAFVMGWGRVFGIPYR